MLHVLRHILQRLWLVRLLTLLKVFVSTVVLLLLKMLKSKSWTRLTSSNNWSDLPVTLLSKRKVLLLLVIKSRTNLKHLSRLHKRLKKAILLHLEASSLTVRSLLKIGCGCRKTVLKCWTPFWSCMNLAMVASTPLQR